MSAHTPGPWRVVRHDAGLISEHTTIEAADTVVACISADDTTEIDGGVIAEVLSPEAQANARLIAAAPDLLEALEDVSLGAECYCERDESGALVYGPCPWCRARAAIAKARGGQP